MRTGCIWLAVVLFASASSAFAQAPAAPRKAEPLPPYNPTETKRNVASLAKGAEYLDRVADFWMNDSCGRCHGNYCYLMARSLLKDTPTPVLEQSRRFMENIPERRRDPTQMFSDAAIVTSAAGLAFLDAPTGKLRPETRKALDMMWTLQRPDGAWYKAGCGSFAPAENDRYYTATLAALAAYVAPEGYARSPSAQDGITRLRRWFAKIPPPDVHHQAMLLWASLHMDGLMTAADRQAAINTLLAQQRPDGGWSFFTLRPPLRGQHVHHLDPSNPPSDGYATGFAVYVLRQAGLSASRPEIVRGVNWLVRNQRESGLWFTASPHAGDTPEAGRGTRELYILNAGTAFAVMALHSCGDSLPVQQPVRLTGLSLRSRLLNE